MKKFMFSVAAALLTFSASVFAQEQKAPPLSPRQTVKQEFNFSFVEVDYSRPSVRGRKIFGELEAFDRVWRTGANAATTITFGADVLFGGKPVKAGKYGLLTIPGQSSWTVILTSDLKVTNAKAYKEENDVARVQVKPETLPFTMETFVINFEDVQAESMQLILAWENTLVPVEIKVAK